MFLPDRLLLRMGTHICLPLLLVDMEKMMGVERGKDGVRYVVVGKEVGVGRVEGRRRRGGEVSLTP